MTPSDWRQQQQQDDKKHGGGGCIIPCTHVWKRWHRLFFFLKKMKSVFLFYFPSRLMRVIHHEWTTVALRNRTGGKLEPVTSQPPLPNRKKHKWPWKEWKVGFFPMSTWWLDFFFCVAPNLLVCSLGRSTRRCNTFTQTRPHHFSFHSFDHI